MNDEYSNYQKYSVFRLKQISYRFNYRRNVIYSYRVEQAINLSPSFDLKNDVIIQKKMICAILIHRNAMELVFILYMYIMKEEYNVKLAINVKL